MAAFTQNATRPRGRLPAWDTIRERFRAAVAQPTPPKASTTEPAPAARQTGDELKALFQAAYASVVKPRPRPTKGR